MSGNAAPAGGLRRAGRMSQMVSRALDCWRIYRPFGVYGLSALVAYRLLGWPAELTVQPAGTKHPVHLRVRTSDVPGCEEILLQQQYALDLPFSPQTIVDAGANIGMASIYFAHRFPEARIISIEPEPANFALLGRNVKPYPHILPINAALWKDDGTIALRSTGPAFDKVGFAVHEGEGVPVRALTMRTLMHEARFQTIDVLKVDIEGAEKEVFESADWMGSVRCLVIELHDRLKPGCRAVVGAAARDFSSFEKGETTIFIRKAAAVGCAQ